MNREKILNGIGFLLLAVCFVISIGRVVLRAKQEATPGHVKIRFAHWQLEGGVRDAFDELAREYEGMHPGVVVEQMAIPERVAANWSRTQLIGGTAPDIIQLGSVMGTTPEVLARYFEPLSSYVDQPNPYNAGTELAQTPWRETFVDGLSGSPNYVESLLDYYGIPSSMFTLRMYYNRELWREILGDESVPTTFEEFVEICRKAMGRKMSDGQTLIAIAGSRYNAPQVMDALFASQTQKLALELDPSGALIPPAADIAIAYLEGKWSWETPAVQSGLELMMRVGKYMQPGFLSLGRDDALFYFVQERALMISTGSWDSSSLRIQVPFEFGVFRIPYPSPSDPRYGQYTLGQPSEAGVETGLSFGITSESKNRGVALDFLRFIASKRGNTTFSEKSGWLPSVVGVHVPATIAPFEPVTEGLTKGFTSSLNIGSDTTRLVDNNLYRLVGPNGSLQNYVSALKRRYGDALITDLQRSLKSVLRNVTNRDTAIGAYQVEGLASEHDAKAEARVSEMLESQNSQETELAFREYQLRQIVTDK